MRVIKSVLWRNKIAGLEHKQAMEWLLQLAKELGISGCTVFSASRALAQMCRRDSARFFELADQPMEMVMAVTEEQANRLFEESRRMDTKIFYIKTH